MTKPQHKVLWRHPRSRRWHQLDLILVRRSQLRNLLITRSYHSADCETDHSSACCRIKIMPRKLHRAKPPGKPRIDTSKVQDPDKVELLVKNLDDAVQAKLPTEVGEIQSTTRHPLSLIGNWAKLRIGSKQTLQK